ncbi:MAG: hypothetical protein PHW72_03625 [Candidatus Pacebacteria bacterium]|nr:hypothetical protein [Candidatus Paceibacterota bacterium]
MCKNISLKKKLFFILGLVLVLVVGGFFYFSNREIKGNPDDYVIKETAEGKFVENEKAGLSMGILENWNVEIMDLEEGVTSISSPDMVAEKKKGEIVIPIKDGCLIHAEIVYQRMDLDQLEEEARYTHNIAGRKLDEFEDVMVDGFPAIRNNFNTIDYGPGIGIYIPRNDKFFAFYLVWGPEEEKKCSSEFDKFLETVSIQ